VGRTRTAPLPDADVPVTLAFTSCQDYVGRWYHAWRALADRADEIDFVLFLGDYIYEYEQFPDLQVPKPGREVQLPDGLVVDEANGVVAARTLADFRHLYKVIRSDADLRRIHQLCPFVIIWDDHEHGNDCWQDHTADFNDLQGDEKDTTRREAATRAWYEMVPVDVPFTPERGYPDDIVTWRGLRWGRHVEMWLTDQRYYRPNATG
jgi:alkaline phosphatase D